MGAISYDYFFSLAGVFAGLLLENVLFGFVLLGPAHLSDFIHISFMFGLTGLAKARVCGSC